MEIISLTITRHKRENVYDVVAQMRTEHTKNRIVTARGRAMLDPGEFMTEARLNDVVLAVTEEISNWPQGLPFDFPRGL